MNRKRGGCTKKEKSALASVRPVRDASHDYLPNLEYNFLVSCKIQSTLTLPGRAARVDQPRAPFSSSLRFLALASPFCRPLLLLSGIYTPAPGICQRGTTWQRTTNGTEMKREDRELTEMKREDRELAEMK